MEISIIGGGITGLTTALALHKVGFTSTVYEQAPELNEIGAGVWLQPNAMQVLNWLGLNGEIMDNGTVLNKMEISYPDLRAIKKIKDGVVADRLGNQNVAIHRGKLQRILYDKFSAIGDIKLGMPYLNHTTENGKVIIEFENQKLQTDVLLGADGIHSKVRSAMGLRSELRNTNQICCRGIANIQLPDDLKYEGKEVWGKKMRFGFSQLTEGKVYFFTVLNREICPAELNPEVLADLFKSFHPVVSQIIKATENLHTTELADLKRLDRWHNENTLLLGDAAHATTPNMGQGACQGIEDAYYISQALKSPAPTMFDTFSQFEQKRRKKVDYVVNNSWRFGKMVHNPFGQSLLKGIMKMTPKKVMSEQMNKLYDIEGL